MIVGGYDEEHGDTDLVNNECVALQNVNFGVYCDEINELVYVVGRYANSEGKTLWFIISYNVRKMHRIKYQIRIKRMMWILKYGLKIIICCILCQHPQTVWNILIWRNQNNEK